tara:strand:- start:62 stop:517 length:456 start_codon:yes stop_codon:yes gene_type:complete
LKNYRLNHAVDIPISTEVKSSLLYGFAMGFFKRLFQRRKSGTESAEEKEEDPMFSALQEQYVRDIEEDVSSIESILADDDDQLEPAPIQPAPDYDRHDASADDVLEDEEMEDFWDKNVIEHTSIEELGNHLENAGIMGDVSTEVSFDSDKE